MGIKDLQKTVVDFRDKRDWKQFNNPKDLAISLLLEASELLEHFQWKNENEISQIMQTSAYQKVKEEIADVYYYLLLISHDLNVDLEKEFVEKMKQNEAKYPIEKAKGSHKKYTEL